MALNIRPKVELASSSAVWNENPSTWTEITSDVRSGSITRGRSNLQAPFGAGAGSLVLSNTSGQYVPQYAGAGLKPDRHIRVSAVIGTTSTITVFRGFVEGVRAEWRGMKDPVAVVDVVDGTKHLNAHLIDGDSTGVTSSGLAGRVLDQVGWAAGLRSISTGNVGLVAATQSDTGGANALERLRKVADSEDTFTFVTAAGNVMMGSRYGQAGSTVEAQFGDTSTQIPMVDAVFPTDDQQLWNRAVVSRVGSTVLGEYSDTGSVDAVGERTLVRDALLLDSDAAAESLAIALAVRSSTYETRADPWRVVGQSLSQSDADTVFGLELGDRVTVNRELSSTGGLAVDAVIGSIRHRFRPKEWEIEFSGLPAVRERVGSLFVLDSSTIGSTDILGW